MDATQCSACGSTLTSLIYTASTLLSAGPCTISLTNNAQYLDTLTKSTVLGLSILKNVTYNSITQSTSNMLLSAFLYKQNTIEFSDLTYNSITFGFDDIPVHEKLIVRVKGYTECSTT